MIYPEKLSVGDLITIVAPAKAIESEHVAFAQKTMEDAGFRVVISALCLGQNHYFSGTEDERLEDLQQALNDPQVKAILCARGGYGCVQIVDRLDWTAFQKQPKWIIGFSDITVLHQRLQCMGIASIHGTMPLNFKENSEEAIATLLNAIRQEPFVVSAASEWNISGRAMGTLIGGNLSILYSLIGTNDQPDYTNALLFIEEVGEPLYAIDRMFHSFRKAGILDQISGLIVGGMTSMGDSNPGYGSTYQEIILTHTAHRNIPVCFNFPAGHINDNRALILGSDAELNVSQHIATLTF